MASLFDTALAAVARAQKRYTWQIFVAVILITIILGIGISRVDIQTDFTKELPQELPIYQLNNRIRDTFSGQDLILVILTIDESTDFRGAVKDIRDPRVISYLSTLEEELGKESVIDSVFSAGTFFRGQEPRDSESVVQSLELVPQARSLFSDDYQTTLMYIQTDLGTSEQKVVDITNLVDKTISGLSPPPGVKVIQTGNPTLRIIIFDLLQSDALYTIALGSLIILIMLFIMERSLTKGILVFIPVFLGLVWTMGTLGWLGIKLSVATVGMGAMILGLGVEYGVFMLARYKEERSKGRSQLDSLTTAVPAVGSAVMGSGLTTMVGFLALTLSVIPMMQHLGTSLALGIAYCLIGAIVVAPVFMLLEEGFERWLLRSMQRAWCKEHARGERP